MHNIRDYNTYTYTIPSRAWESIESLSNDDSNSSKIHHYKNVFHFLKVFVIISSALKCQMQVNFPGIEFLGTEAKLWKRKKFFCAVFKSSIKIMDCDGISLCSHALTAKWNEMNKEVCCMCRVVILLVKRTLICIASLKSSLLLLPSLQKLPDVSNMGHHRSHELLYDLLS